MTNGHPASRVHIRVRPERELVEFEVTDPNGGPAVTAEILFGDFLEVSAAVIQATVDRAREAAAARAAPKDGEPKPALALPVRGLVLPDGSLRRVS